jgi:hypothetical protein
MQNEKNLGFRTSKSEYIDVNAIYELHHGNLGDHWTSYSLMALLGLRFDLPKGFTYKLGTLNGGMDYTGRLQEIDALFSEFEYRPQLVREQGTVKVDPWLNWSTPPLMVDKRFRWSLQKCEPYFCYQFDGLSAAESKNPPPSLIFAIKQSLKSKGYRSVRLGSHVTLQESAELLSRCSLFVGCDSGFSHIAHSVGCPVYMYEGSLPVYTAHRLKQNDIFKSLPEFEMKLQHWHSFLTI